MAPDPEAAGGDGGGGGGEGGGGAAAPAGARRPESPRQLRGGRETHDPSASISARGERRRPGFAGSRQRGGGGGRGGSRGRGRGRGWHAEADSWRPGHRAAAGSLPTGFFPSPVSPLVPSVSEPLGETGGNSQLASPPLANSHNASALDTGGCAAARSDLHAEITTQIENAVFSRAVAVSEISQLAVRKEVEKIQTLCASDAEFSVFETEAGWQINFVLTSSDPDFPAQRLLPDGVHLSLQFPGRAPGSGIDAPGPGVPSSAAASAPPSAPVAALSINYSEQAMDQFPPYISDLIFDGYKIGACRNAYAGVKAAERVIPGAFALCREHAPEEFSRWARKFGPPPWSPDEQAKLEKAIVWYQQIADQKTRWTKIAAFVGGARTARECAERFQQCRAKAAALAAAAPAAGEAENAKAVDSGDGRFGRAGAAGADEGGGGGGVTAAPPTAAAAAAAPPAPAIASSAGTSSCLRVPPGAPALSLDDLSLRGLDLLVLQKCRLLYRCGRCGAEAEAAVKIPEFRDEELGAQLLGDAGQPHEPAAAAAAAAPAAARAVESPPDVSAPPPAAAASALQLPKAPLDAAFRCPSCMWSEHCLLVLLFAHEGAADLARCAVPPQAALRDVLQPEIAGQCASCSAAVLLRNLLPNVSRTATCGHCFSRCEFRFGGFSLGGLSLGAAVAAPASRRPQRPAGDSGARQALRLGSPLPDTGACAHYRKSHRWLRFPCCGRAFPCDVCHDAKSVHPCEWATRMICGFCSREQAYSQKPCACGNRVVGAASAHWEGGKGCRNPVTMSRKDNKKYKLLAKGRGGAAG